MPWYFSKVSRAEQPARSDPGKQGGCRPRLGGRGLGTGALALAGLGRLRRRGLGADLPGLERVQPLGQPAALARRGVLVDRALGGDLVEADDRRLQSLFGLL